MENFQKRIVYLCDRKVGACETKGKGKPCFDCSHTTNIKHAANFEEIDGAFIETPTVRKLNDLGHKEDDHITRILFVVNVLVLLVCTLTLWSIT